MKDEGPNTSALRCLFRAIGSPFSAGSAEPCTAEKLLGLYEVAFPNRVALLYLSLHRSPGWGDALEERYSTLKAREQMTYEVVVRLSDVLERRFSGQYIIFKSIKPYPATPNDTDVICLGGREVYEQMYKHLLQAGYRFHEWAPQQRTLVDERGVGKTGKGKLGGTYYIDLYEEISTDYFCYMDKARLVPYKEDRSLLGVSVPCLRPEPELAIVMFHSVFPERTFQLEHFYLPLYYLADPRFNTEMFVRFCRAAGILPAVRAQISLIEAIHERQFGPVPGVLANLVKELGRDCYEVDRFIEEGEPLPYMFSPRVFWTSFARKSMEAKCLRSLLVQGLKMLNPVFFADVVRSLRKRLSKKGVYHLE